MHLEQMVQMHAESELKLLSRFSSSQFDLEVTPEIVKQASGGTRGYWIR